MPCSDLSATLNALHSPSLPDEATESTIHCAKAETSRRYNSCTSQYTRLFIDISRIDASYTCSKQYQQGPTCLSAFDVITDHIDQKYLYPYVFSLITDSNSTLPTCSTWTMPPTGYSRLNNAGGAASTVPKPANLDETHWNLSEYPIRQENIDKFKYIYNTSTPAFFGHQTTARID